jgi:hypothetical protein
MSAPRNRSAHRGRGGGGVKQGRKRGGGRPEPSPTEPHSPWQNGHAERLIGSIRRECLDHVIVLNAAHLRRVLQAYADYYNGDRTHLALDKDAPHSRPVEHIGPIVSRPVLGGLHRRYARFPPK